MRTVICLPPVCSPICLLQSTSMFYNVLLTIVFLAYFYPPPIISSLAILIFLIPNAETFVTETFVIIALSALSIFVVVELVL